MINGEKNGSLNNQYPVLIILYPKGWRFLLTDSENHIIIRIILILIYRYRGDEYEKKRGNYIRCN